MSSEIFKNSIENRSTNNINNKKMDQRSNNSLILIPHRRYCNNMQDIYNISVTQTISEKLILLKDLFLRKDYEYYTVNGKTSLKDVFDGEGKEIICKTFCKKDDPNYNKYIVYQDTADKFKYLWFENDYPENWYYLASWAATKGDAKRIYLSTRKDSRDFINIDADFTYDEEKLKKFLKVFEEKTNLKPTFVVLNHEKKAKNNNEPTYHFQVFFQFDTPITFIKESFEHNAWKYAYRRIISIANTCLRESGWEDAHFDVNAKGAQGRNPFHELHTIHLVDTTAIANSSEFLKAYGYEEAKELKRGGNTVEERVEDTIEAEEIKQLLERDVDLNSYLFEDINEGTKAEFIQKAKTSRNESALFLSGVMISKMAYNLNTHPSTLMNKEFVYKGVKYKNLVKACFECFVLAEKISLKYNHKDSIEETNKITASVLGVVNYVKTHYRAELAGVSSDNDRLKSIVSRRLEVFGSFAYIKHIIGKEKYEELLSNKKVKITKYIDKDLERAIGRGICSLRLQINKARKDPDYVPSLVADYIEVFGAMELRGCAKTRFDMAVGLVKASGYKTAVSRILKEKSKSHSIYNPLTGETYFEGEVVSIDKDAPSRILKIDISQALTLTLFKKNINTKSALINEMIVNEYNDINRENKIVVREDIKELKESVKLILDLANLTIFSVRVKISENFFKWCRDIFQERGLRRSVAYI